MSNKFKSSVVAAQLDRERRIKHWMRSVIANYIDECGEVNCTLLAENAGIEFDIHEGVAFENLFELSHEVAERVGK